MAGELGLLGRTRPPRLSASRIDLSIYEEIGTSYTHVAILAPRPLAPRLLPHKLRRTRDRRYHLGSRLTLTGVSPHLAVHLCRLRGKRVSISSSELRLIEAFPPIISRVEHLQRSPLIPTFLFARDIGYDPTAPGSLASFARYQYMPCTCSPYVCFLQLSLCLLFLFSLIEVMLFSFN